MYITGFSSKTPVSSPFVRECIHPFCTDLSQSFIQNHTKYIQWPLTTPGGIQKLPKRRKGRLNTGEMMFTLRYGIDTGLGNRRVSRQAFLSFFIRVIRSGFQSSKSVGRTSEGKTTYLVVDSPAALALISYICISRQGNERKAGDWSGRNN